MSSAPSRKLAVVAAVLSLALLGVSPCSPNYAASRNCTDLSLTVTAGGPGALLPSCPPFTDAMEVTFQEQITFTSVPSDLRTAILATRRSNTIQIAAIPSAVPGTELLRIHTEPRGPGLAHDYAVSVTILAAAPTDGGPTDAGVEPDAGPADAGVQPDAGPADAGVQPDAGPADAGPPPPPDFTVSVTANPLVTPTGGTTTLSAVASGGIGPFLHAWRGYRDDGSPFSYTLSSVCAALPTAALVFPGSDFYFFVTVTDCGNHAITNPGSCAAACPGGPTHDAYVRVHEADEAVAQFTVSRSVIHAGVDVTFDASASSGVVTPIGWTLQYLGDVPEPSGIEGYLGLQAASNGTLFWETVFFTTTDLMTLTVPAATFGQPGAYRLGAYRMLLQVNGDFSTHQTYEYFFVQP